MRAQLLAGVLARAMTVVAEDSQVAKASHVVLPGRYANFKF